MLQFLTDCIDQLDLALDQIALRDRNYDRFAFMLIDNTVELIVHNFADDNAAQAGSFFFSDDSRKKDKLIEKALGPNFDAKIKLAKAKGLISEEVGDSILYLHQIRNTVYHRGLRHESIMHSLALFYFICACETLKKYSPPFWGFGNDDEISYRAKKYLGDVDSFSIIDRFEEACNILIHIGESMHSQLAGC